MLGGGQPFVLLDDARSTGSVPARLFTRPVEIVRADAAADVAPLIAQLAAWQADGADAAGWLAYEAGLGLEPRLTGRTPMLADDWPLGWFARFASVERIAPDAVPTLLPDGAGAWVGAPQPQINMAEHGRAVATILDAIRAGDIYQANLTFNAAVALLGHPLALYARLRQHARAGYGGIVFTGTHWLLSFSPELFVSVQGRQVIARPMKGTAERRADSAADRAAAADLATDPKQRAENLMIVDLIRNDLSRVAVPGSVAVPAPFRVETYPTIHQLVSDVTATLQPDVTIADLITRTFPCGSITGAPKLRAMEIIDSVEAAPRGAYTGSIGFVSGGADGEAAFNVAIRTLMLRDGDDCATLGLGSGIVADSDARAEWQECLAKGGFVTAAAQAFDLIETMAFDPTDGIARLDRHIARLGASARQFGFSFDRHELRNRLQAATFRLRLPARIRVRLAPSGQSAILVTPPPVTPDGPVAVAIMPLPVAADDFRLRHKCSDRAFYDEARTASGAFEILFTDPAGQLTEGSFTNIFVPGATATDVLRTPPLARGLLPGVLRAELIDEGRAVEADLTPADLTGDFFIGNSLRGLIKARLA
jgi:para-aminobenzoate synthetase / 4-amino-4-deoxychorismate lyase